MTGLLWGVIVNPPAHPGRHRFEPDRLEPLWVQ